MKSTRIHELLSESRIVKAKKRVKRASSKDGQHHFIGTKHGDKKHAKHTKKAVERAIDAAIKRGSKTIRFHNEGQVGGAKDTVESDLHNHAKKYARGRINFKSHAWGHGKLPHEGIMKDDSDRSPAEFRRAFPRDSGGPSNPLSKKVDVNNRHRQEHVGQNVKDAREAGHASIHIGGEGHVDSDTAPGHEGTPGIRSHYK